jgi:hypothetical protein
MRTRRTTGLVAALAVSSVLTAACGLKPEVKDALATNPGLAAGAGGGQVAVDTDGDGTVDAFTSDPSVVGGGAGTVDGGTGTTGGPTGGGTTGGTTGGGTTGGGTAPGQPGAPGAAPGTASGPTQPVKGQGNTTGINFDTKTIKVVIHGPLTGAGVPQESFRTGGPKYWNGRKIFGDWKVEVEAVDDKYNAQDALRACNDAAGRAFAIFGGAGTDQIQACAQSQVLRRGNVPYVSSGVTEAGLNGLPNYFAGSLTYKQQSPLVVRAAKENGYLNKKWAIVITGTPNFADARDSMAAELQRNGAQGRSGAFNPSNDIILTDKAPRDCLTVGNQLRSGGYEVVYFLGQPLFFGQCVNQYPQATYTGPGPSFGIQSVADLACRGGAGGFRGFYLHPSPDKAAAQAAAKGAQPFVDDIEAGIWGGMQQLEQAFNLIKGPVNRESFIAALAASGTPGGVLQPSVFGGKTRFGGTGAYLNQITCNGTTGNVKTIATYKK